MNITIIGATKGIGKEVLKQALSEEFNVIILARDPNKLDLKNSNVNIVAGDFKDFDSVKKAIRLAEVIVLSVGVLPTRRDVDLFSKGTRNTIKAIRELKTSPLVIAVTGIGAGDSVGHGGFFYDKLFKPLFLNTIYIDKNKQENILRKEYDNWIIVRPGFLTNGSKTGNYKSITNLKGIKAGKISRSDVAAFIIEQVADPTFLKQTPLLMY